MKRLVHSRIQHGVGQGSFHSANIRFVSATGTYYRFDYVYDCGGPGGPHPSKSVTSAVNQLNLETRDDFDHRKVIDVLILSHFDSDHINGAKLLTQTYCVRRIIIPYLTAVAFAYVIARDVENISEDSVRQLYNVVIGDTRTLWGVPVTTIISSNDGNRLDRDSGNRTLLSFELEGSAFDSDLPQRPPKSMGIVLHGRIQGPINAQPTIDDDTDLCVMADQTSIWKLRFWNRGIDKQLSAIILGRLKNLGLSKADLSDSTAIQSIVTWLSLKANRVLVVGEYSKAIKQYKPSWVSEAGSGKLPNLLSIAMFSGLWGSSPDNLTRYAYRRYGYSRGLKRTQWTSSCWSGVKACRSIGWLGTGDAPLGEMTVWNDFAVHFERELVQARTILMPHHGAAPASISFYNSGLNHSVGVVSVISVGQRNSYGHPKPAVVKAILNAKGDLQLVTEADVHGFKEVIWFKK